MSAIRPAGAVRPARVAPAALGCGFTMIELLVTIALIAIITALAAPSFNSALLSNKLAAFANSFVASAQLARSEAIKRNRAVRLCRSGDGLACAGSGTWQQGWIVWADMNGDGAVDPGEVIHVQQAISSDYHFTSSVGTYNLAFQPIGGGSDSATLILCRAEPAPGNQERQIKVDVTGRAAVTSTRTGVCP